MKLVANLMIALSLALGLVAASSAYLADLSRSDADLAGLTLNERVLRLDADGLSQLEVAKKGVALDAQLLAALRAAEVGRVRVEEFAFGRWNERWLFLLALVGLAAGAMMVRTATRAALTQQQVSGSADGRRAPGEELAAIAGIVEELLLEWRRAAPDSAWVLERLSVAIEEHGPAFVAARELLIARMGLGAYAAVMDRFAAAERQLHRAWSAAADDVLEETRDCLGRARVVLEEARVALEAQAS